MSWCVFLVSLYIAGCENDKSLNCGKSMQKDCIDETPDSQLFKKRHIHMKTNPLKPKQKENLKIDS